MTAKRFKVTDNTDNPFFCDWCVTDYADGGIVHHPMTSENMANVMCDLLNEQHKTIEQLKKEAEEYNEDAMSYQTLCEQQLKKSEELLSECSHQQKQRIKLYIENIELKQSNERLLKMLDNVANYMQKQNKYMSIPDFVEWWNGIATKGLDEGDVE